MDGFIPFPCELVPSCAIPPSIIESPICKAGNLRKDVQYTFEDDVECEQIKSYETTSVELVMGVREDHVEEDPA